jgi:hypothetical protein
VIKFFSDCDRSVTYCGKKGGSREKGGGGNEIHAPCACESNNLIILTTSVDFTEMNVTDNIHRIHVLFMMAKNCGHRIHVLFMMYDVY